MDFKRPYKIFPAKIPNLCEFSLNPSNIKTIFSLIPMVFGSRHLSSHIENTTKWCSPGFDEWTSYRSLSYAASVMLQSKNINSIICQNVSLDQESSCPLHRDMNPWGVCWGSFDLSVIQRGSDIHEIHPNSSIFHLTQKNQKKSKHCSASPNQINRKK